MRQRSSAAAQQRSVHVACLLTERAQSAAALSLCWYKRARSEVSSLVIYHTMLADINWDDLKREVAACETEDDISLHPTSITCLFNQSDPFAKLAVDQSQFSMVSNCTSRLDVFYRREPKPEDVLYENNIPCGVPLRECGIEDRSFTCISCKKTFSCLDHEAHQFVHHIICDDPNLPKMLFITLVDFIPQEGFYITKAVTVEAMFKPKLVSGESPDKVYKMRPRPRASWKQWRVIRGFASSEEDIE